VPICPNCGQDNPAGFKFCPNCAAPLAPAAAAREQRKTVTVLFCDLTGSTALGESTDPEALRALLARYFDRMKAIVESHGGTVEKFIGDAVMAVFGVPQVHEDDALRAVRAAFEMRDALPGLGVEARIGINTGEVVTGTEERLATGDAVNVAARLEQAAQPGEVLIGEETFGLISRAVRAEPVDPLPLKGKTDPVSARRLVAVAEAAERAHEVAFVGREEELETLRQAWQRVLDQRQCELVTLVGDAGVGKSRLTTEFLSRLKQQVVRGRCLPYGQGITYWPVVEVVKQLAALPSDPAAAAPLRSLLGESDQGTSAEEVAWAVRKLLEKHAPLVCVFEDIQWGEDTFLDLVEGVALLARAPMLLLCLARPELVERRPEWPVTLRLDPLPPHAVHAMIADVPGDMRERITRKAAGNPLFVLEMAAIARETEGEVVVPPTLKALLAARLDQLDADERFVLEHAAVEGEVFHRGAVQALAENGRVTPPLAALVRKGLIRPHKALLPGDDAFRFRHLLIRDAAYEALPKVSRARLHERFADWLDERGQDIVELDELLGYHLEQAARYTEELGRPNPKLAQRAGERLAAAGRRALWRNDRKAAVSLLGRALPLIRPLRPDVHLELDLANCLLPDDPQRATALAQAAADRAHSVGDEAAEAVATLVATQLRLTTAVEYAPDELESLARTALPLLERAEDHAGLVHVWTALNFVAGFQGRFDDSLRAGEQAMRHSRLAGQRYSNTFGVATAARMGATPADEALATLDALLPEMPSPGPLLERSVLLAMLSRFDEAWSLADAAAQRQRELTGYDWGLEHLAEIAMYAGDFEASEGYDRNYCELLRKLDVRGVLSTYGPRHGRSLCALGRHQEAEPLAELGREYGDEHDVLTQMLWRQVRALVLASRGEHAEAEQLARTAVDIAAATEMLNGHGAALCDLGEVLAAAGRTDEAVEALEQALERYERKKNLAMVAQVKPRLEALRAHVS
jgi:class 3 adenylate cyclase/tetratricopeptide (TPR) repeat protein